MEKEKKCLGCGTATNGRPDKLFCDDACRQRFKRREKKSTRPAVKEKSQPRHNSAAGKFDSELTARLFSDGFYLPELRDEIERVRKTPGLSATLEAHLVHEMNSDAVWPLGLIGRIAVTLALVKNPSLLAMPVKWRHAHERRRKPGDPRKPTGMMVRRGMIRL